VGIERTEYDARQAAARKLARERGFSALVAWSRGGSTQDHYADVYYLTGFYTHQPFIPDEPGRWRAHGHTALVLPLDEPGTLLLDMTELQDPKPAADRVRFAENLVESLIGTVAETVPSGGDVALLGGEALAWRWGRELSARLPEHCFVEADDLAAELRQGAPVRSLQRMPLTTVRWSRHCLPRLPLPGRSGLMRSHTSSVSSPRPATAVCLPVIHTEQEKNLPAVAVIHQTGTSRTSVP
jgi:hypothetical protein